MLKNLFLSLLLLACISVYPQAPGVTVTVASGTVCSNKTALFNSITTNTPTSLTWTISPSNGTSFPFGNTSSSLAVSFRNAGIYTASLTASNSSGTVTAVKTVTVLQAPLAAFSASLTGAGFPNEIDLTNFSANATSYLWSYSDTGLTDNTTDATHTYTAAGGYSVTLVAYNSSGCTDTSRYNFYINDSSGVTLPNVFTPNGDGINDVFKPIAAGMSSLKVDIYTRWGNYVYGWDQVNGYWDGHTTSGEACKTGVYFYVMEATGFDGKTYKLKSYLTLITE
ncbi:MAG: T9SS type B sorting domain-containing protein [Bacteroidia bacterium]